MTNVELLIENLVQAAAEYENNCDRLVAKTIRAQLEQAKQAIRDAIIPDVAQAGKVTDAMIEAAVEAAWPGPEIVYDDNFGSAEAMMKAALEAALAAQPPAAPVETTRLDVAKAIDPGAAWGMAVERDSPANERILQALAKADAALAVSRSSTGAAANRHLIDFISEKIGLPHNEEPSCDNFLAWFVAGEPQKARLFLKISSAIYQLNRAEQSTTDEVVRRHLREIITWLKEE